MGHLLGQRKPKCMLPSTQKLPAWGFDWQLSFLQTHSILGSASEEWNPILPVEQPQYLSLTWRRRLLPSLCSPLLMRLLLPTRIWHEQAGRQPAWACEGRLHPQGRCDLWAQISKKGRTPSSLCTDLWRRTGGPRSCVFGTVGKTALQLFPDGTEA